VRSIDEEFAEFDRPGAPGLALMVIEDGKPSVVRAFGLANLETGAHCRPDTTFRLASLSKAFTAMAIMILAEKRLLSLDDKLPRFFPNFPHYGNEITVRQLLTHTSGLFDYEDLISAGTTAQLRDRDVLEILQRQERSKFQPGVEFSYSNGGYALLALIVESVSGTAFEQFLQSNIFTPLGMNNTFAYLPGQQKSPQTALGYSANGSGFEETDQSLTSAVLGDGGVYSSVIDLFKWDQALYTEKLVSQSMSRQAFTAHSITSDMRDSGYGFGWYVARRNGEEHIWHYGSTCGFSSSFHRLPKRNWSGMVLSNRSRAGLEKLVQKIMP
jgi:CubicO group peptidase (beta-lactamase class C family)